MHRARAKILIPPAPVMEDKNQASSREKNGTVQTSISSVKSQPEGNGKVQTSISTTSSVKSQPEGETVLKSITVSVPQSSKVDRDGKIQITSGRSRNSSSRGSRTGSFSSLFGSSVWQKAELSLKDTVLSYCYEAQGQRATLEILLEDLVGIEVLQSPPPNYENACEFLIHIFPLITKTFVRRKVRQQLKITIHFDVYESFKDNLSAAHEWKTAVLLQAQRAMKVIFEQVEDKASCRNSLEVSEEHSVLVPRTFLVLINPVAGLQRGESEFMQYVKPMFDKAEIISLIEVTKYQYYARELIKEYDLTKIDAIIISSGDGLLYEVMNGLMERKDWETAAKTPIGMLPTGSGNALVASTLTEAGEEYGLEMAAFQIIRGGTTSLDVTTIHTSDNKRLYMTLLFSWGIVADIDIESEKFRKIGEQRFTLGALSSIFKKRVYSGKLSYLVSEGTSKDPEKVNLEIPNEQEGCPQNSLSSLKSLEENVDASPVEISSSDENTNEQGPERLTLQNNATKQDSTPHGPAADLLVPLTEELPNTWVTIEGEFFGILGIMIPFLSRNFAADRSFPIGMGNMRLLWLDGTTTRLDAFSLFKSTDLSKGEKMNVIDVKAFRIVPETRPGIMTIDGEEMHYGPIQGQIHPKLARVLSRKRRM